MHSLKLISKYKNLDEKRSVFFKKNIKSSYIINNDGTRIIFFPKKEAQV